MNWNHIGLIVSFTPGFPHTSFLSKITYQNFIVWHYVDHTEYCVILFWEQLYVTQALWVYGQFLFCFIEFNNYESMQSIGENNYEEPLWK